MNRKQKALKALVIFAVVIALCMFFANTIQTITTPKIQRITASKGKLDQRIPLSAKVHFPTATSVTIKEAKDMNITVDVVHVRVGYFVEKGATIFTAIPTQYDSKMKELKASYDKKIKELAEETAARIKYPQSSPHNDLYEQYIASYNTYYTAQYDALTLAQQTGYTLSADDTTWATLSDVPEALRVTLAKAVSAKAKWEDLTRQLKSLYNDNNSSVARANDLHFEHIKKVEGMRQEIIAIAKDMLALDALRDSLLTITAPHSGYITVFELKSGDAYDGSKAAYSITPEGAEPVLRADITSVTKTVAAGSKVELESTSTTVDSVVTEADGKKYALITLSAEVLRAGGGMSRMVTQDSIAVTLIYKASKTTTLLPASCVRTDSDNTSYVYVVERNYGGLLSSGGYTIKKTTVTVLEKSDKFVSVNEDFSYREIADREDRALTDGQTVMDYVN